MTLVLSPSGQLWPQYATYVWLRCHSWHHLYERAPHKLVLRTALARPAEPAAEGECGFDALAPDLLSLVLSLLPARDLVRCQAVCREWRRVCAEGSSTLWRAACQRVHAWRCDGELVVDRFFGNSYRDMYLVRPRLRTDGVYVSRNTYVRRGTVELSSRAPYHIVVYFRYLAFFADGSRFLYRCTPNRPAMQRVLQRPRAALRQEGVLSGELRVKETAVHTIVTHVGGTLTHLHTWLRLRSTVLGANDRLDVRSMCQLEDGEPEPPEPPLHFDASTDENGQGWHAAEGGLGGWQDEVRPLTRGLSRYVFVHWDSLDDCILNASAEELDFFHPG